MIQKVNRPAALSLVSQPKASENDPGGSQGSGNFYEGQSPPHPESKPDPKPSPSVSNEANYEVTEHKAKLALVVATEQIGMTAVVADFLEQKKNEAPVSPGLSIRYTNDSQPAKGLLLNKKAE